MSKRICVIAPRVQRIDNNRALYALALTTVYQKVRTAWTIRDQAGRSDCDETEYFGLTLSTLIHLVAIPELFEA